MISALPSRTLGARLASLAVAVLFSAGAQAQSQPQSQPQSHPHSQSQSQSPQPTAVGMAQIQVGGMPVTLVYPTLQPARSVTNGPFVLQVAPDATPQPGLRRLVVMSHGTGGSAQSDHTLAATLARAGFVVAQPLHAGDNYKDAHCQRGQVRRWLLLQRPGRPPRRRPHRPAITLARSLGEGRRRGAGARRLPGAGFRRPGARCGF